MASLESSMPPSTHCSAATSCGGVRSKSPSLGAISVTLTRLSSPDRVTRRERGSRARTSVLADGTDILGPGHRLSHSADVREPVPTHAVDGTVDNVCRHAGQVVRTLGTGLWKWPG